jgi:hypothetical protein
MKDNTLGWRAQMMMGAALGVAAGAAVRVDYLNNVAYGLTISPEAATVLGMSAIMVAALPAAAGILGWCWLLRAGTAVFLALTIWCADIAYSSKQGENVRQSQTAEENYTKAKAKETRAKAVLSRVEVYEKENEALGTVKELGTLADKADRAEAEAGKKLAGAEIASATACTPETLQLRTCKATKIEKDKAAEAKGKAEAGAKLAHERLSLAETRDKAEADLAEAEQRSSIRPAEKREENRILTWMFIAATQIAALLGEKAMRLIVGGWQARPQKTARAKRAAAPVPPTGGTREPLPANVTSMREHEVRAWLNGATEPTGTLQGGKAIKAFNRWTDNAKMEPGELRSILTRIYGDALVARTSGYSVRGISLRAKTASQAKAAAC